MNTSRPPTAATWLLEYLYCRPNESPPSLRGASPQLRHWPIAGGERSDEVGLPVERLPSRDVIILGKGLPAKE